MFNVYFDKEKVSANHAFIYSIHSFILTIVSSIFMEFFSIVFSKYKSLITSEIHG